LSNLSFEGNEFSPRFGELFHWGLEDYLIFSSSLDVSN
jgi:hypothetical protein